MNRARIALIALGIFALPACAGTYTGPVEVTRFVSDRSDALGQGTITIVFPDEMENTAARNAFAGALADELSRVGYRLVMDEGAANQTAAIRTTRGEIASQQGGRGPVSVGVGGGTGGFGSGVGVGLGVNLGGGDDGPQAVTQLSVRITGAGGETLWEGRAIQEVSVKSDYAQVDASARALTSALFRDFPGGNGETVTIDVADLQDQ